MNFRVQGMCCSSEAHMLRKAVEPLVDDIDRVVCDVVGARLLLPNVRSGVEPNAIIRAVRSVGLDAEHESADRPAPRSPDTTDPAARRAVRLAAVSGALFVIGLVIHLLAPSAFLPSRIVFGLGILAGLALAAPKAWGALRQLRPDMNLLMTIAVAGAIALGDWIEAGTVAFLFAVALALEAWSTNRARRAVAALMTLTPQTARVEQHGAEVMIPVESIPVGSTVIVLPGERIPLDGELLAGIGHVNQAPITGESLPVLREPGDPVFAATINGEAALHLRTTCAANDTTLARTMRIVQDAQTQRAAVDRWVDRFARIYTPVVMLIALVVAFLPPLVLAADLAIWVYRALILLVIACPCALVISTPVTIVAAMASAVRNGVLIKGGMFLEQAARLRAMAFDKTGTLTRGEPVVSAVQTLLGTEDDALALAAALGARSEHPLAQAIHQHAIERGISSSPATDVTAVPGRGVTGRVADREVWLGSSRFAAEQHALSDDLQTRIASVVADGRTVVVVGHGDQPVAVIALGDLPRPEATAAIAVLHSEGIEVALLTGDHASAANAIAERVGISDVRADLLPADKVAAVEDLVTRHGTVAMIGDGVNDAPAMARATLGIAMGAAGTDAAIETADIALMTDNLDRLPWLVRHSRRALRTVRQNIALALGLKLLVASATFFGFVALWAAIAADVGASLLVVLNGLRLLRLSPQEAAADLPES
ncbi:MAG: heavy metal translocating P-type ATPase [Planctomycetota bacterium]